MGDRALVVFHDDQNQISPTIYLHWNGHDVAELLQTTRDIMQDRTGDVPYAAARFVGAVHAAIGGNLSLGMWNGPASLAEAKTKDYSHGDAGVFLVNVTGPTWKATAHNGYGFTTATGSNRKSMEFSVSQPVESK